MICTTENPELPMESNTTRDINFSQVLIVEINTIHLT